MIRNQAGQSIGAQMVSATNGSAYIGTVTVYITGDAGTQAIGSVAAGVCTHEGNGYYTYQPAQAETDYDLIAFTFVGGGAVPASIQVQTLTLTQRSALSGGTAQGGVPFSSLYGTRLDRELGSDDRTILFTTARRKQAINEGAQEFASLTQCLTRWATVTVTGGTSEYDLNSTAVIPGVDFTDFAKEPVEFVYTDAAGTVTRLSGDDLPRRDVRWLDRYRPGWRSSTVAAGVSQLPQFYYVTQDGGAYNLGFTPVPSTGSSASAYATVPYIAASPVLVNDGDIPYTFNSSGRVDLNDYHQALVHYGAAQLEKYRRDWDAVKVQMSFFQGYVARYFTGQRKKGGGSLMQAKNYFASGRVGTNAWPWPASAPSST